MSISEIYRKLEDYFFTLNIDNTGLKSIDIRPNFIGYEFYTENHRIYTSIILISHYKFDEYLEEFDKFDNKYRKEV